MLYSFPWLEGSHTFNTGAKRVVDSYIGKTTTATIAIL